MWSSTPTSSPASYSRLTIVLNVIGTIIYYILLVFAFVIFLFLEPLIKALQAAMRGNRPEQQQELQTGDMPSQLDQLQKGTVSLPPQVQSLLPWLGLAVALLAIGLLFAWALRRYHQRGAEESDETREIILSRDLLSAQLAALLAGLRPRRTARDAGAAPFLSLDGETEGRRVVRRAYQELLAAMQERGRPRERNQTPQEYAAAIAAELPDGAALADMTGVYNEARYAAQPPDAEQVSRVQQAWRAISAALRPTDPNRRD